MILVTAIGIAMIIYYYVNEPIKPKEKTPEEEKID